MNLWLVRHARPLIGSGICYGALDVGADAQASEICAHALASALPVGGVLLSSPLQRCALLAQSVVERRPDLAAQLEPELREMNFGAWEGKPWIEIDAADLKAWTDDFATYAVGGHGECANDVMARTASALERTRRLCAELGVEDAIWITHAGIIRAAGLLAQGMTRVESASEWPTDAPGYGQWRTLLIPAG